MIWSAFMLGLAGSLHCAGMCGPLIAAVPVTGHSAKARLFSRLSYHGGRIGLYAIIGGVSGAIGQTIAWAGFQQWLSIGAGVLVLAGALLFKRQVTGGAFRWVAGLKAQFSVLLRQRTFLSVMTLGAMNGLLPCGLVYVAAAAAGATGSVAGGMEYMAVFGAGTLPMLLGIAYGARALSARVNFQRLVPYSVGLVAALLILRGLSLGIPYLSPDLSAGTAACGACHSI